MAELAGVYLAWPGNEPDYSLLNAYCLLNRLVGLFPDKRWHVEIVNALRRLGHRKLLRRPWRVSWRRRHRHLYSSRHGRRRHFVTKSGRDDSNLHCVRHRFVDYEPEDD